MPKKKRRRSEHREAARSDARARDSVAARHSATSGRGWVWSAVVLLLAVAGAVWLYPYLTPIAEPPVVQLDEMEPRVREKIGAARARVIDSPRNAEAWGELGRYLMAHDLLSEAADSFRQAASLGSSDEDRFAWLYLLVHCLRDASPPEARAVAEQALEIRSDYSPLLVLLGEFWEQDAELEEAKRFYERAVVADSDSAMGAFGLGRTHLALGNVEDAKTHLERAATLAPAAGAIQASLAQAYRRLGERERAVAAARAAAEFSEAVPVNDPIHFRMTQESVSSITLLAEANAAMDAGDFESAETILQELVELRPEDAAIRSRLGDSYALRDRPAEARQHYETALELNPDVPSALYGLGNMLARERDFSGATRAFKRASELRPEHVETWVNLGSVYSFQGNQVEAKKSFIEAVRLDSDHYGARQSFGLHLLKNGETREALSQFEQAVRLRPKAGNVHLQVSMLAAELGDYDKAKTHLDEATALGQAVPEEFRAALIARAN